MTREAVRQEVISALGDRKLLWFGVRGDEADAFSDLPQFAGVFSSMSRYGRRSSIRSVSYEDDAGVRPDMETWRLDARTSNPVTARFRAAALDIMKGPCTVVPYRPTDFISSLVLARQPQCQYLGVFSANQVGFEYKPWVEQEVRKIGVPTIPWRYIADEDKLMALRLLSEGPIVVRSSRGSGGNGTFFVDSPDALDEAWRPGDDAFMSVSPFLADYQPANMAGVVWNEGVTFHPMSAQIIGVPELTSRSFGYCGNDFGWAQRIDLTVAKTMVDATARIGGWLHRFGYLGAFGVDYMVGPGGDVVFTELNPRFQGSTVVSCKVSWAAGETDVVLEHMAACLGLPKPTEEARLAERLSTWPAMMHAYAHWVGRNAMMGGVSRLQSALRKQAPGVTIDMTPPGNIYLEPEGILAHMTAQDLLVAGNGLWPTILRSIHDFTTNADDGKE